jgi:hypothetical protein
VNLVHGYEAGTIFRDFSAVWVERRLTLLRLCHPDEAGLAELAHAIEGFCSDGDFGVSLRIAALLERSADHALVTANGRFDL